MRFAILALLLASMALLPAGAAFSDDDDDDNGKSGGVASATVTASPVVTVGSQAVRFQDSSSSAASIYSARCSVGASGQGMGGGAAISVENPLCDVAMAYEVAWAR